MGEGRRASQPSVPQARSTPIRAGGAAGPGGTVAWVQDGNGYLRDQLARARTMLPAGHDRGWRARRATVVGAAVMVLFDLNRRLIDRWCEDYPAWWEPAEVLPWVDGLVDAVPELLEELDQYLDEVVMPQTVEVSGLVPESEQGDFASPGLEGTWRTTMLYLMGRWTGAARCFPSVRGVLEGGAGMRGVTNVGLAGLDAGSHIEDHVDPNKGALRFHLPLVVPGAEGDCRIRVGDEVRPWRVGEPLLFDLATSHEVWNDADAPRIVLMAEVVAPLRFPLGAWNRFVQWSYRFFPSYLGMRDRAEALERRGRRERAAAKPIG